MSTKQTQKDIVANLLMIVANSGETGIKAREIVQQLGAGVSKKDINPTLYKMLDDGMITQRTSAHWFKWVMTPKGFEDLPLCFLHKKGKSSPDCEPAYAGTFSSATRCDRPDIVNDKGKSHAEIFGYDEMPPAIDMLKIGVEHQIVKHHYFEKGDTCDKCVFISCRWMRKEYHYNTTCNGDERSQHPGRLTNIDPTTRKQIAELTPTEHLHYKAIKYNNPKQKLRTSPSFTEMMNRWQKKAVKGIHDRLINGKLPMSEEGQAKIKTLLEDDGVADAKVGYYKEQTIIRGQPPVAEWQNLKVMVVDYYDAKGINLYPVLEEEEDSDLDFGDDEE